MSYRHFHNALVGVLLSLVLGSAPAWAQLAVAPGSVSVTVEQGEEAERTLTLTNAGAEALVFCLNFDRPLQRTSGAARLSADALGGACGPYGEVLALADREAAPVTFWDPYGLAMTPDGRLFAAERFNFPLQTYELTPGLEVVRAFEHPVVEELDNSATTTGVTYNTETGTLWWLNKETTVVNHEIVTLRALLVEGDLDGVATGWRIEVPVAEDGSPPSGSGSPVGLAYDAVRHRYYFVDFANDDVWAVDTLGTVIDGYPVVAAAYADRKLGFGLDAHPGGSEDAEGLRFEVATNTPGLPGLRQIVVVGGLGEDTAPGAEPLETPLLIPLPGTEDGKMAGEPVRSTLDPNGVLYYPWSEFQNQGIVAVRPHPLPPSWLVVEAWDGALPPGEDREITLRFRPGQRAAGTYTATLQAFTAETGEAVEVPLSLTVTQEVGAEEEAPVPTEASLSVYPNPFAREATVALALPAVSALRLSVYDVLGRRVAVLHDGPLAAGAHRFDLDAQALPAGVYLVRTTVDGLSVTRPVTIVR